MQDCLEDRCKGCNSWNWKASQFEYKRIIKLINNNLYKTQNNSLWREIRKVVVSWFTIVKEKQKSTQENKQIY